MKRWVRSPQLGAGVDPFAVGDRVAVFHHIPCGDCYYCRKKTFARCPVFTSK